MNQFLTVKTNALRRNANKEFTLNCSKTENALCVACAAFNECSHRCTKSSCKDFIPLLRFAVSSGFESGERRNTIRVGQAWFKRLEVGQKIGLWDAVHSKLIMAVVDDVHWSKDKDELLERHADFNHMVQSGDVKKGSFKDLLISCTGTGFYRNANGLTAVYFHIV